MLKTSLMICLVSVLLPYALLGLMPSIVSFLHPAIDHQAVTNTPHLIHHDKQSMVSTKTNTPQSLEFEYIVSKDDANNPAIRHVEVLLPHRITEAELKQIAQTLYKKGYKKTLIGYHIHLERYGMYWATTHYNPDLKVNIIGLNIEQFNQIKNSLPKREGLIGRWLHQNNIIFMVKEDNEYTLSLYNAGDVRMPPLVLKPVTVHGQTRYYGSYHHHGDYYIIDREGNLQFWNPTSGQYDTAMAV